MKAILILLLLNAPALAQPVGSPEAKAQQQEIIDVLERHGATR